MVPIEHLTERVHLKPFAWAAAAWWMFGFTVLFFSARTGGDWAPVGWFTLFWGLGVANLFFLLKVVASLFNFVSKNVDFERSDAQKSLGFWFVAKLCGLAVLVGALLKSKPASLQAVIFGLGVFVVVPLLGGAWWSRRLPADESRQYVC